MVRRDDAPVDLRHRLVAERQGVTTLAASVADSGWWSAIPDGRSTLIVARACSPEGG